MQFEDRVTIATPEGVNVDLTLAGLGSRFIAALIDTSIKLIVFVGFLLLFGGFAGIGSLIAGDAVEAWTFALFSIVMFFLLFGYDVMFETLMSGRTPGKSLTGLRVVRMGGRPVGFVASSIRNIVRIADILPGFYLAGMVCVVSTRMNQRLGDLAAGTVVVREQPVSIAPPVQPPPAPLHIPAELETWDVSSVTADELATVRRFLERRGDLTPEARMHLAHELAGRLQAKVAGAPPMAAEAFLEYVSVAKARRA